MSQRNIQVEAIERYCDLTGVVLGDGEGWHVKMTKGKKVREGDLSDEAADALDLPGTETKSSPAKPKATKKRKRKTAKKSGGSKKKAAAAK
jgi:hypothetical protein